MLLANTIWAPFFVYCYDFPAALISVSFGFVVECIAFVGYKRHLIPLSSCLRRLALANVISYVAGLLLMVFLPFEVHKTSLADISLSFLFAYLITLPIEGWFLRSQLPAQSRVLVRAVVMSNFASYAVLFSGYCFWYLGWPLIAKSLSACLQNV